MAETGGKGRHRLDAGTYGTMVVVTGPGIAASLCIPEDC
jgi:hypothetical protein